MNEEQLRDKLIAAARNNPPGANGPFAFEKRIMRLVAAQSAPNVWALWGGPLWRAAISCVAITILCGIWSRSNERKAEYSESFSQDFEAAVFAPASQQFEDAW